MLTNAVRAASGGVFSSGALGQLLGLSVTLLSAMLPEGLALQNLLNEAFLNVAVLYF